MNEMTTVTGGKLWALYRVRRTHRPRPAGGPACRLAVHRMCRLAGADHVCTPAACGSGVAWVHD